MIFGYGLLFLLLVMTIGPLGSYLLAQACPVRNGPLRWISYFLFAACLSIGMAIPIAKLENNDKMKISAASANLIGFIFIFIYIILWFSMGLTWTLQKSFSDTLTENIKSCVRNENGIYLFLSIIVGPLIFIDPASTVP